MSHQARRRENRDADNGAGRCPDCGKIRYLSRANAKRQARRYQARSGRVNAYRCGDFWHLGHLPAAVIKGRRSRDDLEAS